MKAVCNAGSNQLNIVTMQTQLHSTHGCINTAIHACKSYKHTHTMTKMYKYIDMSLTDRANKPTNKQIRLYMAVLFLSNIRWNRLWCWTLSCLSHNVRAGCSALICNPTDLNGVEVWRHDFSSVCDYSTNKAFSLALAILVKCIWYVWKRCKYFQ